MGGRRSSSSCPVAIEQRRRREMTRRSRIGVALAALLLSLGCAGHSSEPPSADPTVDRAPLLQRELAALARPPADPPQSARQPGPERARPVLALDRRSPGPARRAPASELSAALGDRPPRRALPRAQQRHRHRSGARIRDRHRPGRLAGLRRAVLGVRGSGFLRLGAVLGSGTQRRCSHLSAVSRDAAHSGSLRGRSEVVRAAPPPRLRPREHEHAERTVNNVVRSNS
jgi:hypothetical protein